MTIRTKLLVFIPLLVLLANSVTFFLFQSGKVVQMSYDLMMDRILLYKQSLQTVEDNLQALYGYLVDPDAGKLAKVENMLSELSKRQSKITEQRSGNSNASSFIGYVRMMDTLKEQAKSALTAAAANKPHDALSRYEEAEQTTGFIRQEEQRLVDLELSQYQPVYRQIQLEIGRMYRLGAAVFIVNTLLGAMLAVWISRSITGPVDYLVQVAKQIAKGNLNVEPAPQLKKDELGVLSGAMRHMLADLKAFIEKDKEHLETDRLIKELELKTLQSQINPHFLFNTLNVLSKLALLEGAEQTSDLIVSMSNLMRYNLRKLDQPVILRDELEHVKEYMNIQQARFRDRVRFELKVDEAALREPIPALTLQPLLENAFVHGIEGMEQGAYIQLKIVREPEAVRITITDNGRGMSEEIRLALLRLEAETYKKHSTGLGTRNVFKRLELFYGCNNMVDIQSEPGKGTKLTIRIPSGKEELLPYVPIDDRR